MTKTEPPPDGLGLEGRKLWAWAERRYEIEDLGPLLAELCELKDRLEVVRASQREAKEPDPKLIAAECKLTTQFQHAWRLLGLAEDDEPKRRPGRPAGVAWRGRCGARTA
jgi:hypothetical protein